MIDDFSDRVALVSGGARGIGGGAARGLAEAGATVVIADVLEQEGKQLAEELADKGAQARFHVLDVRSESNWTRVIEEIGRDFGRLDVLVNAAGILRPGAIEDTPYQQYKQVMDISADGTFLALRSALPLLKRRSVAVEYAAVVNISSIAAFRGSPGALSYAASRAAVLSMTKSAAVDFANHGYKIRVNSVHPGSVETELSKITYQTMLDRGMTMDQILESRTSLHPLGRLGRVEDITEAVLFLASDRASWVTGASLVVDGGRTAWSP